MIRRLHRSVSLSANLDVGAFLDRERDVESPLKRMLVLTYIAHRLHPDEKPDVLNRLLCISDDSADVARFLKYTKWLELTLSSEFKNVHMSKPVDVANRIPKWLRYGTVLEMYRDIKRIM